MVLRSCACNSGTTCYSLADNHKRDNREQSDKPLIVIENLDSLVHLFPAGNEPQPSYLGWSLEQALVRTLLRHSASQSLDEGLCHVVILSSQPHEVLRVMEAAGIHRADVHLIEQPLSGTAPG